MLREILPNDKFSRHIFILWFILAVCALAFSGIYSFFPYALRTPFFSKFINMQELFSLSLMVHVNLGVLVWFMATGAMLMGGVIDIKYKIISFVSFITAMVGSFFIIVSPFVGAAEPVKNDYIPIMHNFCFILGISLFLCAILVESILCVLSFKNIGKNILKTCIFYLALFFILAAVAFVISSMQLKQVTETRFVDLQEYYQLLFWGAGHILQFCYIQLLIVAWIALIANIVPGIRMNLRLVQTLLIVNFIIVALSISIYAFYRVGRPENYEFFTQHMRYWGGNLTIVIAFILCYNLCQSKDLPKLEKAAFFYSLMLIVTGGIIGFLINGANVTVPAHYHGVILGITVSLMGLFYIILPAINFNLVEKKQAYWQLSLYSIGQLIHISALAISGGYGVLRKNPGEILSFKAKIFMGMMGIGGSIALIGGIMFVVLILKNMKVRINVSETN